MKKITVFLITLFMAFAFDGWGQVFMTELADPNNNANARFIELYNIGTASVDFTEGTGWRINKYTNGSTTVSLTLSLTGSIAAGGFYIIAYDYSSGTFLSVYGFAPDQLDAVLNGVAGSNGDDTFELIDGTGAVVDFYGVQPHADLTGTVWEYEDGRAERATGATSGTNPPVDADWNTWSDGPGGNVIEAQNAPDDFDPGSWIGAATPVITVSPSSLTGFSYIIGSGPSAEQSFTTEGSNLTADISLIPPTNYEISIGTGGSFVATNPIILTQTSGTVTTTMIYTRLMAGLSDGEYNNENITASSAGAINKVVSCSGSVYKLEPSNHVTSFTAMTNNSSTIDLSWTENDGAVVADGYLIKANTGTVANPEDGIDPDDDTDLTDGIGNVKVTHGTTSYSFNNCSASTTYNFNIYPFTNSGTAINFKIDGDIPSDDATTSVAAADPVVGDLIITEVSGDYVDGVNNDNGFMEIYNASSNEISLTNVSARYYNTNPNNPSQTVSLSGSISAGYFVILTQNASNFQSEYGIPADFTGSSFWFNGGDDGCDIYHATNGILDQFNDNGIGQSPWTWSDSYSWDRNSLNNGATQSNWTSNTIASPKSFGLAVWTGGTSTVWDDDDNWTFITPSSTTNVTIPTGLSNYPTLTATGPVCNNLLIESDASLVRVDYLIVNSTATVERSINAWTTNSDGFHFLSSPVSGLTIATSDFLPVNGTDDFYEWDEPTGYWLNYFDGLTDTDFGVGKGYLVGYNPVRDAAFTGSLNTSVPAIPLSFTTDSDGEGWNLLGNPFPSAIDWDLITKTGNIGGTVHVLRGSDNTYIDWNGSAGDLTDGHIPINNGFFILANEAAASITMEPADQVHGNTGFVKKSSREEPENTLKISVASEDFVNNTYIQFRADASLEFDNAIDGYKLFGSASGPQAFTILDDIKYSINCLPFTTESFDLPFGFVTKTSGEYDISTQGANSFTDAEFEVILEDLQTSEKTNIGTGTYTFTTEEEGNENRFILHFHGVTSVDESPAIKDALVYAHNKTVYIKFNQLPKNNIKLEVFNTLGQQVALSDMSPASLMQLRLDEKPGIYIVRLHSEDRMIVQKVLIN